VQHLIEERETGKHIAPVLALKGWRRDIANNSFYKNDKAAYFANGFLIICFSSPQLIGKYSKSFHRVKLIGSNSHHKNLINHAD
jgi:hypothetical protein